MDLTCTIWGSSGICVHTAIVLTIPYISYGRRIIITFSQISWWLLVAVTVTTIPLSLSSVGVTLKLFHISSLSVMDINSFILFIVSVRDWRHCSVRALGIRTPVFTWGYALQYRNMKKKKWGRSGKKLKMAITLQMMMTNKYRRTNKKFMERCECRGGC